MGQIKETIKIYERLRKNIYSVSIENGVEFSFEFMPGNYHHLAGLQHLGDLQYISSPHNKDKFYRELRRESITGSEITASVNFHKIKERIENFARLEQILKPGDSKVIIQFDNTIPESQIKATYFLFEREGTPWEGEVTYYHLFFGYDKQRGIYYPATYIVEHSNTYVRDQEFLDCSITVVSKR